MRMHNQLIAATLGGLIIIGAQACHHNDDEINPGVQDSISSLNPLVEDKITILQMPTQTVPQPGGQTHIKFKSTGDWSLSISKDAEQWISVMPKNGGAGDNVVTINIKENPLYDERNCGIDIKTGNFSTMVTVSQKQKDAILLTSNKVEVPAEGGEIEIEVSANIDFVPEIAGDTKWISPAISKAMTKSVAKFKVEPNESVEPRSSIIAFKAISTMEEVKIFQKGIKQTLVLGTKEFHFGPDGGNARVEIESNCHFNESMPGENWLFKNVQLSQDFSLCYDISANPAREPRSAFIEYTTPDKTITEKVWFYQDAFVDKMEVEAESSYQFNIKGGKFSISVDANTEYTIEMPDWIAGDSEGEAGEHTHTFTIGAFNDYDGRSGQIVVTNKAGNISKTINVVQNPKVDMLEIGTYPTETFGYGKQEFRVSVQSSERWVATVSEGATTWITCTPQSGEVSENEITISISGNNTYKQRSGTVTITCGTESHKIEIAQEAHPETK